MSFVRKAAVISGGTMSTAVMGMLQSVVIARALGPDDTGQFRLAITVSTTVVSFLVFGLSQSNVYFLNKKKADPSAVLSNSLLYSALLGTVSAGVIYALFTYLPGYTGHYPRAVIAAFAAAMPLLHLAIVLRPILIAQMRSLDYSLSQLVPRLAVLAPAAGLALVGALILDLALVLVAVSEVVAVALLLVYLRRDVVVPPRPDLSLLGRTYRYGLQLYAVNLLTMIDQQIAVLFLGFLVPGEFELIGFFTRATAICGLIRLVPNSIALLLYSYWSSSDRNRPEQVQMVLRFAVASGLVLAVAVALAGKPLIIVLYGRAFLPAYAPLMVLVAQQALWVVSRIFQSFFSGHGKPMLASYSLLLSNGISVVGLLLLIPRWDIVGAAVAVTAGQACCVVLNMVQARIHFGLRIGSSLLLRPSDLALLWDRVRRILPR